MTNKVEHLVDWLRDAYAMEQQANKMFAKEADRLKDYSEIQEKFFSHAQESKGQANKLEQCLQSLGENTSTFKTGLGKMMGVAQAFSGLFASDEIVKACVAAYAFKHYEIGNYHVLIAAAEAAGKQDIAEICREILQDEQQNIGWIEQFIPVVTNNFLEQEVQKEHKSRKAG